MMKTSEDGFDELPGWQTFHMKDQMVDIYTYQTKGPHTLLLSPKISHNQDTQEMHGCALSMFPAYLTHGPWII